MMQSSDTGKREKREKTLVLKRWTRLLTLASSILKAVSGIHRSH